MLYGELADKDKDFECSRIDTMEQLNTFIDNQKAYKPPRKVISLGDKVLSNEDLLPKRSFYIIYRGIKESKFPLNTSLQFRWGEITHFYPSCSQKEYLSRMVKLLENNEIIKQYLEKDGKSYSDISVLALMQHYGLPTPLLDWTPNIETGLNFAYDGIDLREGEDEISNYVSLYYINLDLNYELQAASYQNILVYAKDFLESVDLDNADVTGASLKNLFTINDLGIDFIYIDYSIDAPFVQDIFGNVLSLLNPNLEKQEGAFIINFNPNGNLDYYWNKKSSPEGTKILREYNRYCDGLGMVTFTISESPNEVGIIPKTKINCVNIKKSVLNEWINNGGLKEHYDKGEESRNLKEATLKTYYSWLLSGEKDYDFFRTQIIKGEETEDQKIAKEFLEEYQKNH